MNSRHFTHYYLIDRCVISRIKASNLTSENEVLLRGIDRAENRVSPLIATFEGQSGRLQTSDELMQSILKDTEALGSYFKHAETNDMLRLVMHDGVIPWILNTQREQWDRFSEFVGIAQRLLYQDCGHTKRKTLRDELLQHARRLGVQLSSIVVLCVMACLYRQPDALKILKPSPKTGGTEASVHNALQDLIAIRRFLEIRMLIQLDTSFDADATYLTFDGWVSRFVSLAQPRPKRLTVASVSTSRVEVSLSSELFPGISKSDLEELGLLLGAKRELPGYSPKKYDTRLDIRLQIPKWW